MGHPIPGGVAGPILDGKFVHTDEYFKRYPPKDRANYWQWRVVLQGSE